MTTIATPSASIRALERGDLQQVAELFLRVMRPGSADSPTDVATYFERTALDSPWADPEIPSLVFVEGSAVKGFLGSYVSRVRFDGRPVRVACPGNFVTAPDARNHAAGALLLRRYMNGPQAATFCDTAGEPVRRMWERLGAEVAHVGSLNWIRVFRPCRTVAERLLQRHGGPATRAVLPPVSTLGDKLAAAVSRGALEPPSPAVRAETLTPQTMIREWRRLTNSLVLYPDYDEDYLEWLFDELSRPRRRGTLVRHLVHDGRRVLGWYLYYLKPGGVSRVLQVAGGDNDIGSVLDHLLAHAHAGGAAVLEGRVDPRLLEPLAVRRCWLRYAGGCLVNSRNREIISGLLSRHGLFSRMDSEYWPVPPRSASGRVATRPDTPQRHQLSELLAALHSRPSGNTLSCAVNGHYNGNGKKP